MSVKRRYPKHSHAGISNTVEEFGVTQVPWRPPTAVRIARQREIDSQRRPKTWTQFFREYRGYADCVLDYFRTQGFNAHFAIRVATDRNWTTDVRDQKYWLEDVNRSQQCNHFMYRGEGVFYGVYMEGTWKFGLKDVHTSLVSGGIQHRFPLEGRQFRHEYNCTVLGQGKTEMLREKALEHAKEETAEFIGDRESHRDEVRKRTIKAGKKASLLLGGGNANIKLPAGTSLSEDILSDERPAADSKPALAELLPKVQEESATQEEWNRIEKVDDVIKND